MSGYANVDKFLSGFAPEAIEVFHRNGIDDEALQYVDMDFLKKYPDPRAGLLVDKLAAYHGLEPSQVFVGVGSDDVIAMSFMTFFNSGKPVLFPDITYSFYDVWADMLRIPYE